MAQYLSYNVKTTSLVQRYASSSSSDVCCSGCDGDQSWDWYCSSFIPVPLSRIVERFWHTDTYVCRWYSIIERLENCISDIQFWMITNKLQLNSSKKTSYLYLNHPILASILVTLNFKLIIIWSHLVTLPNIFVYSSTNIRTRRLVWLVSARRPIYSNGTLVA